jgi:ABC-type hemin transport system ATPase subunit
MRDLVKKVSHPITRSYGVLSVNTKLAFWYQLAEMIKAGTVVSVPANYKMTREANIVLSALQRLELALPGLVGKMYSKIQSCGRVSGTNHRDTEDTKIDRFYSELNWSQRARYARSHKE